MENKKPGHISEKELDSLLNEAFLNLDFETNPKNKEVLKIVSNHAMQKNGLFRFFNSSRINLLFFLVSALIFLTSFFRYVEPLITKDEKVYQSNPLVNPKSKKISANSLANNHPVKTTNQILDVNSTSFTKTKSVPSAKNSSKRRAKKNNLKPISESLSKASKVDSTSMAKDQDHEILSESSVLNNSSSDSLSKGVSFQKNTIASPPVANKKSRPVKKIEPNDPNKKVKVGKRRKGSFFGWMKKKKRGSKKFLKTSGR